MLVRFAKNVQPRETRNGEIFVTGRPLLGTQVRIFGEGDRGQREDYLSELAETLAAGGVWHVSGIAPGLTMIKNPQGQAVEYFKAWAIEVSPASAEEVGAAEAEHEAVNREADRAAYERRAAAGPQAPGLIASEERDPFMSPQDASFRRNPSRPPLR
jgi:hypothetical protein